VHEGNTRNKHNIGTTEIAERERHHKTAANPKTYKVHMIKKKTPTNWTKTTSPRTKSKWTPHHRKNTPKSVGGSQAV